MINPVLFAGWLWGTNGYAASPLSDTSNATWVFTAPIGSGAGLGLATTDLDFDGAAEVCVGAPYDNTGGKNAGAVFLLNNLQPTAAHLIGAPGDGLGTSLATGDFNGDHVGDVLIGGSAGDQAWVVLGLDAPSDGQRSIEEVATPIRSLRGFIGFGQQVATAGDLDADGLDDFLIGEAKGADGAGAVHLFYGTANGWDRPLTPSSATAQLLGEADGDRFSPRHAAHADYNGDGFEDLALAARNLGDGDGRVYVWWGEGDRAVGALPVTDLQTTLDSSNGGYLGGSMATLDDWNGDGYADLAAGAFFDDARGPNAGAVHVYLGDADGWGATEPAAVMVYGDTAQAHFGSVVAGPGDLNQDGFADAVFGEAGPRGVQGALYVFSGGPDVHGVMDTREHHQQISSATPYARFAHRGVPLTSGDVDGDGYLELIAGAHGRDQIFIFTSTGL